LICGAELADRKMNRPVSRGRDETRHPEQPNQKKKDRQRAPSLHGGGSTFLLDSRFHLAAQPDS